MDSSCWRTAEFVMIDPESQEITLDQTAKVSKMTMVSTAECRTGPAKSES